MVCLMIKNYTVTVLLSMFFSYQAYSQASLTEEQEVMQVVRQLFEGMKQGDTTLVHPVFHPNARLMTVIEKEGKTVLEESSIAEFIKAIGKPHQQIWDERIHDPVINMDGALATVWTAYSFYLDETFSHCGVDAFQLMKSATGWQIIQITDTRRKGDCG